MSVSSRVVDATSGAPAVGVAVSLWESAAIEGEAPAEGAWTLLSQGHSQADGTVESWAVRQGIYRLVFAIGAWWAQCGMPTVYPEAVVTFSVTDPGTHCHVTLLVSPYAYTATVTTERPVE
ncbi:hydroxyisourate hydrolase [Thermasporomyces composti]|jgi:5-hydroxyisourate hydrolase|nr:hydroxyisourate hydrolase [Thermasporomyces composti]